MVLTPVGGIAADHHRARRENPDNVKRDIFEPHDITRFACR